MVVEIEELLLGVARIAAKELIATVAREQSAHAIGVCHLCAIVGGQRGRIAEGLIEMSRNSRNAAHEIAGCDVILVVFGLEVGGREPGKFHFVVALRIKPD